MSEQKRTRRVLRHPVFQKIARIVAYLIFVFGAMLIGFSVWISRNFGVITIDQAIVNIQGAGGDGAGGSGLIWGAIISGVIVPLVASGLLLVLITKTSRSSWRRSISRLGGAVITIVVVTVLVGVPVAGAASFSRQVSLPQYISSVMSDLDLNEYYVAPEIVASGESEPKNLVIIYMESVEDSLSDDSLFEQDMLAPIEEVTTSWNSFELHQPANGGWTLGGIVDTQCGIPLRMVQAGITGDLLNSSGEKVSSYLSGALCLGDVLSDQGYTNVFMGGASDDFAGKGTFLADHGYDEVYGYEDWVEAGETEFRDWGLSDRRLLELAEQKITELHDSGEPFNLTLLTLDTHPNDYALPYCNVDTDQGLTSVYRCSMQQVASFVNFMDEQGYLSDTVVVLMGDHLRISGSDDTFHDQLTSHEERTIFNRIWSPDTLNIFTSDISQFDMYPTILESLGFTLKDGRAGLGVSAFVDDSGGETLRSLSQSEADALVQSRSQDFYNRMWGVD